MKNYIPFMTKRQLEEIVEKVYSSINHTDVSVFTINGIQIEDIVVFYNVEDNEPYLEIEMKYIEEEGCDYYAMPLPDGNWLTEEECYPDMEYDITVFVNPFILEIYDYVIKTKELA